VISEKDHIGIVLGVYPVELEPVAVPLHENFRMYVLMPFGHGNYLLSVSVY